ncbi:MAG: type VI secretion system ATPase TssH, partial [Candidatus Moranbacteria bacterium]|nr:type VI secretion system ATPase TssH [Candidatus Moranbacteria bacterium]
MNISNFTQKSQEALRNAQENALSRGNAEFRPEHLLYALLLQEDSVVPVALSQAGADLSALKGATLSVVDAFPKGSTGPQLYLTPALAKTFDAAEKEMKAMGDSFVSTEHLLLGLLSVESEAKKILERSGADRDKVLRAL